MLSVSAIRGAVICRFMETVWLDAILRQIEGPERSDLQFGFREASARGSLVLFEGDFVTTDLQERRSRGAVADKTKLFS